MTQYPGHRLFTVLTHTFARTEAYMRENENKNKIDVVYDDAMLLLSLSQLRN